jgi:tRNA A37 threonylcarbamoyladenosine modification protein TsaB
VHVVIDAQRGELYVATYEIDERSFSESVPLKIGSVEEVLKRRAAGGWIAGPEVTRWFANGRVAAPRARAVGILANERAQFVEAGEVKPVYLRPTTFAKNPSGCPGES